LELLYEIGRFRDPARKALEILGRDLGLEICPITYTQVAQEALGVKWTRDPFDRMIVAHAGISSAPLVTKNRTIRAHYRRAIW
jgi:PIN domain nuclease of toxin-antitoxin system